MIGLSIVIPCHNEEEVFAELRRRLESVTLDLAESFEIILVDDGSTDHTWNLMQELGKQDSHYVCIKLTRNFGHQRALTAGLDFARGQRILILDADLQDPPELLPEMLTLMDQGYHVVYGQRIDRQGEGHFKRWTASLFYRLINRLAERPIPVDTGDFRLLSRKALDALKSMPEYHRFVRGMVSWVGLAQVAIPYTRQPRVAGQSKYPLPRMIGFALDAITGFSIKPLTIASWLGAASASFGVLLIAYSLYSWLFLNAVHGWTSIIAALAVFNSIQLLVLGVLGEYLGRLYEQSKNRPLYLVDEVFRSHEA
ncbi:glycosyltransferase family 2 protein [bacterium]|nr:glycosyltransferase family 2 protein [bacterium]